MSSFSFERTSMKDAYLIHPLSSEDNRGQFIKDYERDIFIQNGLDISFYETFETLSYKNVVRGLHFQTSKPQAKLVRAVFGEIYDVIVDLRKDSETFGKWEGFHLSDSNKMSLYVPEGYAHGFAVYSEIAIVSYKCVWKYSYETDSGILWNDKELSIDWRIKDAVVSDRDKMLMTFEEFKNNIHSLM